ncbi:murein L,D-transpeptidase [Rhodophyticola sp. CCM32]|uniref:L,D-transpeptidase family protein n=1 Tax=Rhodophyticola sp. CCM32 TaxID=2916397 RepID=UPI00107F33C5|nr:L,D-transpeptidase family protein [Rhodophyticola sp. CCM32]QBY00614.1 murein L,D-transpeptidase [Rhodophyticola sp. CCM32]
MTRIFRAPFPLLVAGLVLLGSLVLPQSVTAQPITAQRQAIAEAASSDEALAQFYRDRNFEPVWATTDAAARRNALLTVLDRVEDHGLPVSRYDADVLRAAFRDADTPYARGQADVLASRMFLQYARDVQSGMLDPDEVVSDIVKDLPRRDPLEQITEFTATDSPYEFMRSLPPSHPEYVRLMREKLRLERVLGAGGWGPAVPGGALEPGDTGGGVIALRNRLIAMGYLGRSATATYDTALQTAVQRFQEDHGLTPDGEAGTETLAEINVGVETRLGQIILGMERQRWMNRDRGERHILVNIADFHAYVIDGEEATFETRVVVGHRDRNRHTPEFSDVMEHMIINPSWNVPRSIAVNEYLPQMRNNPGAAGHLQLVRGGRVVSRQGIDFSQYTARNFPFDLRQPPSSRNALGEVKFMFPNRHNIYLHDTPSRNLFDRQVRAYSHGCVRVHRPQELAYHLLAPQEEDPEAVYQTHRQSGRETQINLETQIPVHLVYWTAWITPEGRVNYRDDVYGRNALLWQAMQDAGVAVRAVTS